MYGTFNEHVQTPRGDNLTFDISIIHSAQVKSNMVNQPDDFRLHAESRSAAPLREPHLATIHIS